MKFNEGVSRVTYTVDSCMLYRYSVGDKRGKKVYVA